ncbi:hypothetical protein [Candidatus Entotheonella palauensis]|uniref:Hemerythrin-like domain-containing protein n=1 Tax=Candidatus Entotheonella gemina TaxID=1429439 RepID=W4M5B9_9BACT|nr:hypothetical protein [Candidatus Entotheonella palauensis]ETX05395.1 MAG: hypothetical protein ETSY2_23180 [Candidatus Entotheonella gemina]
MKPVEKTHKIPYVSPTTATLLTELGEECQHILKHLSQLEQAGLGEDQVETMLGELSAAILHVHEHTRDLDVLLDEDCTGHE